MTRTDSLGQSYNLNWFAAYCSVNNNKVAAGDAIVAAAPGLVTPPGLLTVTITLTAAAFSIAFTGTPLGAAVRLFAFTSPQRSPGRAFESDYRLMAVSAVALASPMVITTPYTTRLGTPIVGQRVFVSLQTYQGGFVGQPFLINQLVA